MPSARVMEKAATPVGAVLFDFFGTLVDYEPRRSHLEYPRTVGLLRSWGFTATSPEAFVADWDASARSLEATADRTLREFSMADAALAFSDRVGFGLSPDRCQILGSAFVAEWQRHVVPVPGVAGMLRRLSETHRVGVVSNTHDRSMVPDMLRGLGVADLVEPVVLSVEHGRRKPHPSIYDCARSMLPATSGPVVFVGDDYEADYVGPEAAGMTAYLIDPAGHHPVPADRTLDTVLAIEAILRRRSDPRGRHR